MVAISTLCFCDRMIGTVHCLGIFKYFLMYGLSPTGTFFLQKLRFIYSRSVPRKVYPRAIINDFEEKIEAIQVLRNMRSNEFAVGMSKNEFYVMV